MWLAHDASEIEDGNIAADTCDWRLPTTSALPPTEILKPPAAALMTATDFAATELARRRLKPPVACGESSLQRLAEVPSDWEQRSTGIVKPKAWACLPLRVELPVAGSGTELSELGILELCSTFEAASSGDAFAAHFAMLLRLGPVAGEGQVVEHFESSPSRSEMLGSWDNDLLGNRSIIAEESKD